LTLHGEYIADVPVFFPQERYLLEHQGFAEGVIGAGDFAVTQRGTGANMSVDVAVGSAWIKVDTGTRNGLSHAWSDAIENVAIAAAHATLPRIDRVVVQYNDSSIPAGTGGDTPTVRVVTGTATSGATLDNETGAPAVPADALHLADVLVAANASSILTTAVRDRRPWATSQQAYVLSASSGLTIPVDSKNERLVSLEWELEFSVRPSLFMRMNGDTAANYRWAYEGSAVTDTATQSARTGVAATSSSGVVMMATPANPTAGFSQATGDYQFGLRAQSAGHRVGFGHYSVHNSIGSANQMIDFATVGGTWASGTAALWSLTVYPDAGTMTGTVRVRRVKP
jgi:hypothetical protein